MVNQKEHATLLAKKIFLSNNQDEVCALISLDLDVDWLAKYSDHTTLAERAFRVINDESLFQKWWANVQRQHPNLNVWSDLSNQKKLVSIYLQPAGCYNFKSNLLQTHPGDDEDQKELANQSKSIESALNPTWEKISVYLRKNSMLLSLVEILDKYRKNNLYLTAPTEKDFKTMRPEKLSASNALDMYIHLNSHGVSVKNLWYLFAFMDSPWEKWSNEQWKVALENHSPGLLVRAVEMAAQKYGSYTLLDKPRYEKLVSSVEKFYKKMPDLGPLSQSIAQKDTFVLSTIECKFAQEDVKRSFYRAFGRGIQSVMDKIKHPTNEFSLGVTEALLDTTCFKSTMLSTRSLKCLKNTPEMPSTVEELCQKIDGDMERGSALLKIIDTNSLPMLMTHVAVCLPTDQQTTFLQSLQENGMYRNQVPTMSLGLMGWSIKGMETAQNDQEKSNWANIFWQSVFNTQVANQHYWLKKIHGIQDFIVPIACWNPEFESLLMKALEKRKTNDVIQSVLSKMSLVNATAGLSNIQETPKRRSKM